MFENNQTLCRRPYHVIGYRKLVKALSPGFNVEIDEVNEIGLKYQTRTKRSFLSSTVGMHQCLLEESTSVHTHSRFNCLTPFFSNKTLHGPAVVVGRAILEDGHNKTHSVKRKRKWKEKKKVYSFQQSGRFKRP